MSIFEALLLGMLQGLTEFLPVSSSGHLVLAEHLFNIQFDEQTMLSFDVFLHAGTLLALVVYFWKTWEKLIITFFKYFSNKTKKEDKTLLNTLILATIPIIIGALILKDVLEAYFRTPLFVTSFMGVVGIVFLLAETFPKKKDKTKVSLKEGIIIGLFQVFALIPGVSRSGITISVGMFQGINRHKAAEFSFLLGTIAILAATSYVSLEMILDPSGISELSLYTIITGLLSSFIVSLACVHYFLKFLKKYSLKIFAYYLIVLSIIGIFLVR